MFCLFFGLVFCCLVFFLVGRGGLGCVFYFVVSLVGGGGSGGLVLPLPAFILFVLCGGWGHGAWWCVGGWCVVGGCCFYIFFDFVVFKPNIPCGVIL